MKKSLILHTFILALSVGCRSETNVLPANTWSSGCMQLAPNSEGYRLTGECCVYVQIPRVALLANNTSSSEGSYHRFTGAGYSNIPIRVTGSLSPDENTLALNYVIDVHSAPYTLKRGVATASCSCYFD